MYIRWNNAVRQVYAMFYMRYIYMYDCMKHNYGDMIPKVTLTFFSNFIINDQVKSMYVCMNDEHVQEIKEKGRWNVYNSCYTYSIFILESFPPAIEHKNNNHNNAVNKWKLLMDKLYEKVNIESWM